MFDLFRQEHVKGKIVDKCHLKNGNIGLVVEDQYNPRRYSVEFRDGYKGPSIENLYGLLKDPFSEKTEQWTGWLRLVILSSSRSAIQRARFGKHIECIQFPVGQVTKRRQNLTKYPTILSKRLNIDAKHIHFSTFFLLESKISQKILPRKPPVLSIFHAVLLILRAV